MATKLKVYGEDEAKARLAAELPHWYLEDGWIRRKYRTSSWKGTLMVINAVGHLAEAAWHHPDLTASYAWVEVRLISHDHKGLTDKEIGDIALDAGVPADVVERFTDGTYEGWLAAASDAAFDSGVKGTPTVLVNGETFEGDLYAPGPLTDAIESAAQK